MAQTLGQKMQYRIMGNDTEKYPDEVLRWINRVTRQETFISKTALHWMPERK